MLTDIELKLLRLALDRAAPDGEYSTAAIMFIKKLRERNANADDLFNKPNPVILSNDLSAHSQWRMPFGKYKDEMLIDIPTDYLIWVLQNCRNIKPDLRNAIQNFIYEFV